MGSAIELKEKGNTCMKENKHMEAIIHYTHALHSDPSNHTIFSNRSLAFFKEQQHFFALEDAKKVITLEPHWFKGYARKAEVEYACHRYAAAVATCALGLGENPDNDALLEISRKSQLAGERQTTRENRYPVLGIGTGVVVGIVIIFADELLLDGHPYLENIFFKLAVVFVLGALGKALAELYKYGERWSQDAYLQPPPDIFGKDLKNGFFTPDSDTKTTSTTSKTESMKKKRSKKD